MSRILVVIPTFNEKDNVRFLVEEIHRAWPEIDILFVDDNSPDGTGRIIDEICEVCSYVRVIHRAGKQGLGRAYIAGFKWALERDYDLVFEMDADFSHEPTAMSLFLSKIKDADLVLGSRFIGGMRIINWPPGRLILSALAVVYVRMITGMRFSDPTGGFKCYRRSVLESINLDEVTSSGYSFQIEMTYNAWIKGFRIVEVPVTFRERRFGQSKMSTNIVREALWMVWRVVVRSGFRRHPPSRPHPKSVAAGGGGP
ncbi:MAG: polyprenol monophosphomannose synthase [Phycisphaerae bacterium]|nr:polyprenol monophosphomannose synthase [Phycisphaerae bacterium]